MPPKITLDSPLWFVLNYIDTSLHNSAEKTVVNFNTFYDTTLEIFAPTYVVREEKNGEIRFRDAHLTFHYVFVRGTLQQIKLLCSQQNGFSFLIDHGSTQRYAVIDDTHMAQFMTITRAYNNCLPYFPLNEINLEDGDLVEVVKGDFPGLKGYFMPNPKSKTGNIILRVFNKVGTIAFNVNASDVRILEFSPNSTRANDQIDAFVPNLLAALRLFRSGKPLPIPLAAKLSVFSGRMEDASMHNRKLNAKLQILLYAANIIIGNHAGAQKALAKFNRVADSVTNEWTRALITLILAVTSSDFPLISETYAHISSLQASSKARKDLMREFEYYVSL